MHRAVVELDSLPDADGAGADNDDALLFGAGNLALRLVAGVVIRRHGLELRRAGVYHLVGRDEVQRAASLPQFRLRQTDEVSEFVVGEAEGLRPAQEIIGKARGAGGVYFLLEVHEVLYLRQEPDINLGERRHLRHHPALAEGFRDGEDAFVGGLPQALPNLHLVPAGHALGAEAEGADLKGAQPLEQRGFESPLDGHDLAGGLHLRADGAVGGLELVEGPAWDLHHTVVQGRLETGERLLRHRVGNFIEAQADRDLRGDAGDWVAGGFRGQGGGAADSWIDFDHDVIVALRVEAELHVAAAFDAERADDLEGGAAEHLVLLIPEGLRGSDDDGVAGMDAHRINVFHVADGDAGIGGVSHHLILDLFPADHALLDKDLVNHAEFEAAGARVAQLVLIPHDPAARPAEGVGRTHDHGIADGAGERAGFFQRIHDRARRNRLADGLHGIFEALAVFGLFDSLQRRAEQLNAKLIQDAGAGKLRRQIQSGLASQRADKPLRTLLLDHVRGKLQRQRLDINPLRHIEIRHDRRRVGVDQHNLNPLLPQRLTRLRPGIIKLRRLSDDDGAGAYHHYFF